MQIFLIALPVRAGASEVTTTIILPAVMTLEVIMSEGITFLAQVIRRMDVSLVRTGHHLPTTLILYVCKVCIRTVCQRMHPRKRTPQCLGTARTPRRLLLRHLQWVLPAGAPRMSLCPTAPSIPEHWNLWKPTSPMPVNTFAKRWALRHTSPLTCRFFPRRFPAFGLNRSWLRWSNWLSTVVLAGG